MRNVWLIVLGLFVGIVGTVMTVSALRHGPSLGESLMTLQDHHMDALGGNLKANRCALTDNLPNLQALRSLANDLEPAFLPIDKEADFRQKASDLRASLDAALAAQPSTCPALSAAMQRIGRSCKSCHDEFRN